MARQHSDMNHKLYSFLTVNQQTKNTVSSSNSSQIVFEGVYGCFMTCNVCLAGNREVSLELQCLTAELITYIVLSAMTRNDNQGRSAAVLFLGHFYFWGSYSFDDISVLMTFQF